MLVSRRYPAVDYQIDLAKKNNLLVFTMMQESSEANSTKWMSLYVIQTSHLLVIETFMRFSFMM